MKKILYILLLLPVMMFAQTNTENYVKTVNYRDSTSTTNETKAQISITYIDGLGRPMQTVALKAGGTTNQDIVTPIIYDVFGRQDKQYLPYVDPSQTTSSAALRDNASLISTTLPNRYLAKFPNDLSSTVLNPYSQEFYEPSPLNRVLEQAAPGMAWAGSATSDADHTIKFDYQTNVANEVIWFGVSHPLVGTVENTEDTNLEYHGYYPAYQLYKNITKNENWKASDVRNNTTEEFKDKEGHLVLKRTYDANVKHDTYYIYDRYNNLTYVIPPRAADQVVYNIVRLDAFGRNYPWTDLTLVDKSLADSYNNELKAYDNSTILNANLLDKYGGQGGFSVLSDEDGNLSLTVNITTTSAMPYRTGIIADLKDRGTFKDRELGKLEGSGYSYIFVIKDNAIVVTGSGKAPSTNTTFAGLQKLDYSKNYPWTTLCKGDKSVITKYEADIASLPNFAILTTYTPNSYGASGGVAISVDPDDTLTLSLNISSTTALSFRNGAIIPLEMERRLTDGEIGTVSGTGYNYRLVLQDNALVITGSGTFTHINISFNQTRRSEPAIRQSVVEGLCYTYHYDYRNRMIEKRIPDNGWTSIVYDKLDRPVLTQDEALKSKGKYLFTKYDALGRVAYTGEYIGYKTRKVLQEQLNNATGINYESRQSTPVTIANGNVSLYYTNDVFPTVGEHNPAEAPDDTNINLYLYTINYYDDYAFDRDQEVITQNWNGTPVTKLLKGLPTGSKVRALGTDQWETIVSFYDSRARPIYVDTRNAFLASHDIVQTRYYFNSLPVGITRVHYKGGNTLRIDDAFTYDNPGRLLKHTQTINSGTPQLIAWNKYDELGQLIEKKVGGTGVTSYTSSSTGLQTVNNSFNIRGWLSGINNISGTLGSGTYADLFAFGINYNTTTLTGSTALYNGNISETHWKTKTDNQVRNYSYKYDALNRLTDANYSDAVDAIANKYTEGAITYDKNGNILKLNRYGFIATNQYDYIDKLTYTYMPYSNKLLKVTDAANSTLGFLNGTSASSNDYRYDTSGNMVQDLNKGLGSATTDGIIYDYFNLPGKVIFAGTNKFIEYTYDANGTKLQKKVTNGENINITQYDHGYIYKDEALNYFSHPEGYVDCLNNTFSYIYQYKDHLGSVRLSYKKNGSVLQTVKEDNYYAFGMSHQGYNTTVHSTNIAQHLKFNGKESNQEQGLDWYDYGARNYDAAIGRWMNIDPLSEQGRRWSPYTYAFDNPIYYIDPDGMWPWPTLNELKKTYNDATQTVKNVYNQAKVSATKTYDQVKASTAQTYTQAKTTAAAVANTTMKATKEAAKATQKYVKEHKEGIKAIAEDVKTAGDFVTDAGLTLAALAVVTEGVTAAPGLTIAAAGEAVSLIGEGINVATDLIAGDVGSTTADVVSYGVSKAASVAVDKILPGPNPDVSQGTKQLIESTREMTKNKVSDLAGNGAGEVVGGALETEGE